MKKVVFLPYDFDTAIGINNEGALVFSYNLEDIDNLAGGADVYNGQQSVLWKNMRAAFFDEIKTMYQNLRSTGALSYEKVEAMFEEHQDKWPEAIFNEDAYFKYLQPLIDDGSGAYLSMLQGSKAEQRKWWLYNRFRYIDSKYNAGDALSDVIQLRGYAKADITVTPYADIYPSVKYGSYLVSARGARTVPTTLVCPLDNLNDTEIYIYSASQLASVGDLSGLLVGFADLSMATKLQRLKLGDSSADYSNSNLTELTLGNNTLLQSIDVRNCPNLTQSVDLSGCTNIEEVYFDGTAITGCTLPNGGVLKVLQLPGTITNLTVRNQPSLTTFSMPTYENISTLRIENVSSAINAYELLQEIPANSRVRIIGLNLEMSTVEEVENFYDLLDSMRGLDENGNNTDTAQVKGTITGLGSVTGSWLASLAARYPDITVEAEHITAYLHYYTYDGATLLYSEEIQDGGDGVYDGQPTREATAAATFTFAGWNRYTNQYSADASATKNVTADRNVYAAYTAVGRTYTVYFYNGSTLLKTVTGVPYGGSTSYTGETPVYTGSNPDDYRFTGWSPQPTNITGTTSCYAVYAYTGLTETITDSWEEILAAVANGTYKTKYQVGGTKILDVGSEGSVCMQIAAFDADTLADGTGKAPISWISEQVLITSHRMNPYLVTNYAYKEGNGWGSYSNATSTSSNFYVSGNNYLKASEEATWKLEFTAASAFKVQVPSCSINSSGSGLAGDYEYEVTVNGTTIYKNIGGTVSVATGTLASVASGEAVSIVLRFKQDSKATLTAYRYLTGYLKFTDSADAQTSLATVVYGSNSSSWTSKATITFSKNQIRYTESYTEGTGSIGGWEKSEMRAYLNDSVKPQIPALVRAAIKPVTKTHPAYNTAASSFTQTTTDEVWLPSYNEMFGSSSLYYPLFQNTNANRIKKEAGATSASWWWLRSANDPTTFYYVSGNGYYNYQRCHQLLRRRPRLLYIIRAS